MAKRISIEVPAENADEAIVEALRHTAEEIGDEVKVERTASADSYSLTIHVFPDEEK
jgi:hypothetical protein